LHTARINALAWSPDGRRIASGSTDKTVRVWDPTRGEELLRFDVPDAVVTQCQWSPDGRRLAAVGADGTILIWDASAGHHYLNSQEHVREQVRARQKEALELLGTDRKADALALLVRALEILKTALGPDHDETLESMHQLAHVYQHLGQFSEAAALFEQLLTRRKAAPGSDEFLTQKFTTDLATAYHEAGRLDRAEPLLMDAIERSRKGNCPQLDQSMATLIAVVGLNRLTQHKYADAEPLLRECLMIRERDEPDQWTTFNTKSMLGGSLLGQKKYDEAEPMLLAGYEGLKRSEEAIPPIVRTASMTEAVERLVQLYDERGRKDQAGEWRRKLPATTKSAGPAETKKD
jgi:tetratricopeptide (TPR) repeat protein